MGGAQIRAFSERTEKIDRDCKCGNQVHFGSNYLQVCSGCPQRFLSSYFVLPNEGKLENFIFLLERTKLSKQSPHMHSLCKLNVRK